MTVTRGEEVEFVDLPGRRSGDPLRRVGAASSVRIVRMARGRERLAHRHPESEEIVYVNTGSGIVYVDGARLTVAPGDTVHIPRGAAHVTVPDPGEEMELICFFPHPSLSDNFEETDVDAMRESAG